MKKTKKALSLFLAVLMLLSCLSMTAFAAEPEDAPAFESYLCLGSSVTRGCGLPSEYYYTFNDANAHYIPGNYPSMVADALGIAPENCWNCSYQGEVVNAVLSIMGLFDETQDPFLDPANYTFAREYFVKMQEHFDHETGMLDGQKCSILDKLSTCDLITIELGMGDVFYRTMEETNADSVFNNLGDTDLAAFAKEFLTALYKNYEAVVQKYPIILNYIKENNPDATVVMVSNYNMFADMTYSEEIFAPIGDAFAILSVSMNQIQKAWAKDYGYLFADISNVETLATENDWSVADAAEYSTINLAIHPSVKNGIPFIARQVLNALDSVNKFATTNIILDLGAIDHVDYVLVDSRPIENYVIEGHNLIIPYYNGSAKLLTLGVANDGVLAAHSYQLSFGENGYTAYKIGAINDTFSYAQKLFKTIFELIQSLWTKILDLFGIAR